MFLSCNLTEAAHAAAVVNVVAVAVVEHAELSVGVVVADVGSGVEIFALFALGALVGDDQRVEPVVVKIPVIPLHDTSAFGFALL